MDIIIASNNKHKIREIKEILGDKFDNIFSLSDKNIDIEIEETGLTFYENALIKAETICKLTGLPTLSDDSGLEVEALNGAPGVYSARYAGEPSSDKKNNELLLKNLKNITNRKARFTCVIVLCYPDGSNISATGYCNGEILFKEDGNGGFGYDPLFYSYDLKKSFGVATGEEKNSVSHRAIALKNLYKLL